MKRIFTFFAAALLSSGAFAQAEWKNLVVNSSMEEEQDPEVSSFWCHEWRVPEEQFDGPALIVEDPTNPENHCARVVCRSQEQAQADGTMIADGDHIAGWDSQFFVYATEPIPAGKELRLTMRIMAEKEADPGTQAHNLPGDYNHWQCFGNPHFTTTWTKWTATITVSNDMVGGVDDDGNALKGFQAIAFNLADFRDGNIYYFDDIKLEMRDPKGPEEFAGWFNFLRHGTLTEQHFGNFTTFTGRDGADGVDRKARIVEDPIDGQPALNVTAIGWNGVKKEPVLDEEGNPVLDENGQPTFTETQVHVKENGDTLTNIDNWQTQFFVTVPHQFGTGQRYKLVMWARADKDATLETQAHLMPGGYKHWDMVGQLNLTPEWQQFVFGDDDANPSTITSDQNTCQTIAFNCNVLKEDNNYYFRFDEFSFNAADVTEEERTLDKETVMLPVPEPGKEEGATGTIDFSKCLEMLETSSFENLVNENMTVQNGEETFAVIDVSAGGYITEKGWLTDEESPIALEFGEVSDSDPTLSVTVFNDGESFAGKTIDTAFRYEYNNWFYLFNVTMVPEQTYQGVSELTIQPRQQGVIYDLSGRRVQQAGKGIFIRDGKKFIQ